MVKDPVCGMMVNSKKPPATAEHGDQMYFFCSLACKDEFENNPELFLRVAEQEVKLPAVDSADSENNI